MTVEPGPELNLVVLRVGNLDRARGFYEALGLRFVDEQHGSGRPHLAATLSSGTVLELYPREVIGTVLIDEVRLGFTVGDIDQKLAAARNAGGKVVSSVSPTDRGRMAVLKDSDGRRVELREPAPSA